MFARSSRSAFICLRCQTRLARQDSLWSAAVPSVSEATIVRRRWQSLATARVEDEEDGDGPSHMLEAPETTSEPSRRHGRRIWRPPPVAQLGVSSLGKPAEVLVLQPRDRIIPKVPTEPDQDSPLELQESLDSELRPLSPEQLKENIEQIRTQVGQKRGQLEEDQWKELRVNISKGFTQKQLASYIEQMQGSASKKFRLLKQHSNWKHQMAYYIAKHIWGFSGPGLAEDSKEGVSRTEVKVSRHKLEALLNQKNSPLRHISEKHKVQLDVFRGESKVAISGATGSVLAARGMLRKLKLGIQVGSIALDPVGADLLQPEKSESLDALIRMLEEHNGVHIEKNLAKPCLDVHYHQDHPDCLLATRRDLLLATRKSPARQRYIAWPAVKAESTCLVPFYPPREASWSEAPTQWGRCRLEDADVKTKSISQLTDEEKAGFGDVYQSLRDCLKDPLVSPQASQSGNLREEYFADFGQVLFDRLDPSLDLTNPASSSKSLFTTKIPLLVRFLASRTKWFGKTSSAETNTPNSQSPQFVFRILLLSVQEQLQSPPIEIVLTGADAKLGLKQPLQIHSVGAMLQQRSAFFLLPLNSVDIHFTRQVKEDIYRSGAKPDTKYARLLAQLAGYLNEAQGKGDPVFSPFVTLDVPKDIHLLDSVTNDSKKESSSKGAKKRTLATSKPHTGPTEYMLAASEVVDVASFFPPFYSHLSLDHIQFNGHRLGGDRQVLRLAEQPLFEATAEKKVKFASFFHSALEISMLLGDPKLIKS